MYGNTQFVDLDDGIFCIFKIILKIGTLDNSNSSFAEIRICDNKPR